MHIEQYEIWIRVSSIANPDTDPLNKIHWFQLKDLTVENILNETKGEALWSYATMAHGDFISMFKGHFIYEGASKLQGNEIQKIWKEAVKKSDLCN